MIELALWRSCSSERMNSLSASEWKDYYEGLIERAINKDNDENTTGNNDKISYVTIEYNEESGDPTNLSIEYSDRVSTATTIKVFRKMLLEELLV